MNALVIGGNGFIGSHLVDRLIEGGHNVRVFDLSHERYREPLVNVDYRISTFENVIDLYESFLGVDIMFYLASVSVPSTSNIDTVSDINNNLIPALQVINMAIKLGLKRIVFFSSGGAVYGIPKTVPITEEHPLNPISSYGIIKATIEKYLYLYQRMYGINPLILRPSNPYGPRQGHYMAQGVISTFLRKAINNEELTIFGDGNSAKDYIYIEDLVDLTYELSFSNQTGIFNLGSGTGTTLNQIIDNIKKITEKEIIVKNVDKQIYDVEHFVLDISKTKKILNNYPNTSLEVGIFKTWKWLNSKIKL